MCPECGGRVVVNLQVNAEREGRGMPRIPDVVCTECEWVRRRIFIKEKTNGVS